MLNVYLYTARYLIASGHSDQALDYLSRALGECNRDLESKLAKRHVMAALSFTRRIGG